MLVTDDRGFNQVIELLKTQQIVVLDTETNGLRPYHGDRLIGIALYFPGQDEGYYLPFRHETGTNLPTKYLRYLVDVLPWPGQNIVLFNSKFDLHFMAQDGFRDPTVIEDVMLAAQLFNENEDLSNNYKRAGAYTLKRLAVKYLGEHAGEGERRLEESAALYGVDPKKEMYKLPAYLVEPYAVMDVVDTWELRQFYLPHLRDWGVEDLYYRRNQFVLKGLLRMERNGMQVDLGLIEQHMDESLPKADEIAAEFDAESQRRGLQYEPRFNIGSWQQLKAFYVAGGKSLPNTDKYTLTALAGSGDQWAQRVLDWRSLTKATSTYYSPYLRFVDKNGIIRPNLNPIGTVSGRPSSDSPNFLNIPREGKYTVKQVFKPRPGYVLMQADYSQLELRLATHYAQEAKMRQMINDGEDMHQYTANALGVSRYQGKTANFSFLYGMGKVTGALRLGTSEAKAQEIITGWRNLYPGFQRAYQAAQVRAKEWRHPDGSPGGDYQFVRLMSGRARRYQEYLKYPYWTAESRRDGVPENPPYATAWNFMIQGTAAILTEESIIRLVNDLPDNDIFRPTLTIYDSIIAEVREDYVDGVARHMRSVMEDWPQFDPPIKVDIEVSDKSWADLEEWHG